MDRLPPSPLRLHRRLRRAVLTRRRPLAALAAGLSVAFALQAATAPPPSTELVVTAAHDLAGGTVIAPDDLVTARFPPQSVPDGAESAASPLLGRTTAGPVRSGEPITDVRLVNGSLLDGYPGLVAAPVRIADAGAVRLLRVGDRVDVLAADPQGRQETSTVAEDVAVIALPRTAEGAGQLVSGGLVVLAVTEESARRVATAGVSHYMSVVIRR